MDPRETYAGMVAAFGACGAVACLSAVTVPIKAGLQVAYGAIGWKVLRDHHWNSGDWSYHDLALSNFVGNLILSAGEIGLGGVLTCLGPVGAGIGACISPFIGLGEIAASPIVGEYVLKYAGHFSQLGIDNAFAIGADYTGCGILSAAMLGCACGLACCAACCRTIAGDNANDLEVSNSNEVADVKDLPAQKPDLEQAAAVAPVYIEAEVPPTFTRQFSQTALHVAAAPFKAIEHAHKHGSAIGQFGADKFNGLRRRNSVSR